MDFELHPEYVRNSPVWEEMRDVIAGEDAIKARGEKYLPRLSAQDDDEYRSYKNRATFFNATKKALESIYGQLVNNLEIKILDEGCEEVFLEIESTTRTPMRRVYREVLTEYLTVGKVAIFTDWDASNDSVKRFVIRAEDILNWEFIPWTDKLRAITFSHHGVVRELVLDGYVSAFTFKKKGDGLVKERDNTPMRHGRFLRNIPVSIAGNGSHPDLKDLADLNLCHYRLIADYMHGLHYTALPTAWASGFEKDTEFRIGSSVAWVSETPGAQAGFLEFKGQGLDAISNAIAHIEKLMIILGGSVLEMRHGSAETAEAVKQRLAAEKASLHSVASALERLIEDAARDSIWWASDKTAQIEVKIKIP